MNGKVPGIVVKAWTSVNAIDGNAHTHTHRSQCYRFHVRKILLLLICRPFRNTFGGSSEVKGWAEVVGVCLERLSLPSAIITIPLINRAGLSYLPAYYNLILLPPGAILAIMTTPPCAFVILTTL